MSRSSSDVLRSKNERKEESLHWHPVNTTRIMIGQRSPTTTRARHLMAIPHAFKAFATPRHLQSPSPIPLTSSFSFFSTVSKTPPITPLTSHPLLDFSHCDPSHVPSPQDLQIIPNFLPKDVHDFLVDSCDRKLRRLSRGPYAEGHFDQVIKVGFMERDPSPYYIFLMPIRHVYLYAKLWAT
jgi:hypothetical protein